MSVLAAPHGAPVTPLQARPWSFPEPRGGAATRARLVPCVVCGAPPGADCLSARNGLVVPHMPRVAGARRWERAR